MTAKTQKITERTSQQVKEDFHSLSPEQLAALMTVASIGNRICPLSAPIVTSAPIPPQRVTPLRADISGSPPEFVAPPSIPNMSAQTLPPIEKSPEDMPKAEPLLPPPGFGRPDDAETEEIRSIVEALLHPDGSEESQNIYIWYVQVAHYLKEGKVSAALTIADAAANPELKSHLLIEIIRYLQEKGELTDAIGIARRVPDAFLHNVSLQELSKALEGANRNHTARVIKAELSQTFIRKEVNRAQGCFDIT